MASDNKCEHDIDIDTSMTKPRCVKCGLDANVIEIHNLTEQVKLMEAALIEITRYVSGDIDNGDYTLEERLASAALEKLKNMRDDR